MKKILILLLTIICLNSFGQIPSIGGILFGDMTPVVSMTSATLNTGNWCSIVLVGNVTNDKGITVTERGHVWNTTGNPTILDTKYSLQAGTGTGSFTQSIPNFEPNTTYYIRAYAINAAGISYSPTEISRSTPDRAYSSATIEYVNSTSINITANISANTNTIITRRLHYGISYVSTNILDAGSGNTDYTWNLTGLTANTTYLYWVEIRTNNCDVDDRTTRTFTTQASSIPASIATTAASSITTTSANSGGYVFDEGSYSVTERGICYNTTGNPTTSNTKITDANVGTGGFTSNITGLTPNTVYYVKAYAITSLETSYGLEEYFRTNNEFTPSVITSTVSNIAETTATSGGNVTSQGTSAVTARGICWNTSQNPTTANSSTASGSGTGTFTANLTGLTANTTYYVRAYATNTQGTSYGNNVIFTTNAPPSVSLLINSASETSISVNYSGVSCPTNITEIGAVLSSSTRTPTIANTRISEYPSGVCAYNNNNSFSGLNNSTEYYIRAFITNTFGTFYSAVDSITTGVSQTCPVVSTTAITNIMAGFGANGGGNVTSTGGASVTARGICWNTTGSPTIANNKTVNGNGLGSFSSTLTNLQANTTYYVRAYATNGIGTCYGSEVSFRTWPTYNDYTHNDNTSCTNYGSAIDLLTSLKINGTTYSDFGASYSGAAWKTLRIIAFHPDIESDGRDYYTLRNNGSEVSSFPVDINITGLVANANTLASLRFYDVLNQLCKNIPDQISAIDYQIIDVNNAVGETKRLTYKMVGTPFTQVQAAREITSTSAIIDGLVYGSAILTSGIYWNTNNVPGNFQNTNNQGSKFGNFTLSITGLTPSTTYYYSSFATSSSSGQYPVSMNSFTTLSQSVIIVPSVRTTGASNVGSTTATTGGTVLSDGGATVSARGICYGTSVNPTISGSKTTDGGGVGTFTSSLTGLTASTVYYYRSYATNSVGTSYGEEYTFTTTATTTTPTVIILTAANNITSTGASLTGQITNNGGLPILARGVCWSTSENPTLANNNADGETLNTFNVNITGLTRVTGYWCRTYATNSLGTSYSNQQFFLTDYGTPVLTLTAISNITSNSATSGGTIVDNGGFEGNQGICWSLTPNPTLNNFSTSDTGNPFTSNMTGLYANTTYYVRAYLNTFQGVFYSNELSFTTSQPVCTRPVGLNTYSFWYSLNIDYAGSTFFRNSLAEAKQACFDWNSPMNRVVQIGGQGAQASSLSIGQTVYANINTSCDLVSNGYYLVDEDGGKKYRIFQIASGVITAIYNGIEVGDSFGGGLVACLLLPSDPGYRNDKVKGIIVSPDIGSGTTWGCYGTNIAGAESKLVGAGTQNTADIMTGCATAGIAARVCDSYSNGGFSDWVLPSHGDMAKLATMKSLGFGSFSQDSYWTSTEDGTIANQQRYWAFVYDMRNGAMFFQGVDKSATAKVRAVRYY